MGSRMSDPKIIVLDRIESGDDACRLLSYNCGTRRHPRNLQSYPENKIQFSVAITEVLLCYQQYLVRWSER